MAAYQASSIAFRVIDMLVILIGILFILIALALQERMQAKAPHLMRLAVIAVSVASALMLTTAITGFLGNALVTGTKDISAYRAFLVMHSCLGSAGSNAWGWGILLIGWAALRTRALPRILGYIILAYGIVQIFRFAVAQLETVVGLLFLISMVWLGVVLLRKPEPSLA